MGEICVCSQKFMCLFFSCFLVCFVYRLIHHAYSYDISQSLWSIPAVRLR